MTPAGLGGCGDDADLRAVIAHLTAAAERVASLRPGSELLAARTAVLQSYLETLTATERYQMHSGRFPMAGQGPGHLCSCAGLTPLGGNS